MRSHWNSVPALLLLPVAIEGLSFDCKDILADGQHFDLHELGGPKTVHWQRYQDPSKLIHIVRSDLLLNMPLQVSKTRPSQSTSVIA